MIKFINHIKRNRTWYICEYNTLLDKAINNFKSVGTVRVFKNTCYIQFVSFAYFLEILNRDKVKYTVITTLL